MNNDAYIGRCLSGGSFIARIALCSLALTLVSQAQERCFNKGLETEIEVMAEAERVLQPGFFRDRQNYLIKAECQLKRVLQSNRTTPYRYQLQENLVQVQEMLASHDLLIAGLYMSRLKARQGSMMAAESRLLEITRLYRRFSQMDEVLLRLGMVAIQDERPDDAAIYLWKLVCHYPDSTHRSAAFEKLAEVGFRSPGCDCLEQ